MMEDKNVDKLFQEQLQSLAITPHKRVWNAIEAKLKKKKRSVFPIVWLSSGIAALLVIGFFIFYTSEKSILKDSIRENPSLISNPKKGFENTNTILKENDTLLNNREENTLLTEKKMIPKKNKKNHFQKEDTFKKSPILIATKVLKNSEKEKITAQKNAMEKTFLAEVIVLKKEPENNNRTKTQETFVAEKSIETAEKRIAQKEDIRNSTKIEDALEIKTLSEKAWIITPVFAVLNANSFGNTSPIDKSLGDSTEGNNSYSYGVKVAYQIASKLTFQSGIHLQEMSYSNRKIAIIPSISSASSLVLDNTENFVFGENSQDISNESEFLSSVSIEGSLNQKYGYIEIPMEIKYQVLQNKKVNTQLVAGFSSLILNKNQIEINTATISKTGKVDNLNTLNFSGNLGVDFNYTFQQNWSLHINPMFKAQLNTFSENANGFQPYFIGVYTGINYHF